MGIGTLITRAQELTSRESIGAREVKVEITDWVDYVFDRRYNLPTLQEAEKQITDHLKVIPSFAEVGMEDLPGGDEC